MKRRDDGMKWHQCRGGGGGGKGGKGTKKKEKLLNRRIGVRAPGIPAWRQKDRMKEGLAV